MKRSSFITWDQLRVGLVIVAALGILTLAVYKLGQAANLFTKRYELVAFLKEANGLRVGGTVTLAGQLAGTVKRIDFLPVDADTTRNLKITVGVDQSLKDQIRTDSKAQIRTMGLLGDKIFDISPGTPRHAVLKAGDTIAVSPALDYEQVLAQAAGAVDDGEWSRLEAPHRPNAVRSVEQARDGPERGPSRCAPRSRALHEGSDSDQSVLGPRYRLPVSFSTNHQSPTTDHHSFLSGAIIF